MVFLKCPSCGKDMEILPEELFADTESLVVTGCNNCTMWWINIPGTEIEDFDALMKFMNKVIVETDEK